MSMNITLLTAKEIAQRQQDYHNEADNVTRTYCINFINNRVKDAIDAFIKKIVCVVLR